MRFPNAYEGVKKIHKAEIMVLAAAGLTLVAAILSGITDKNPDSPAVVAAAAVVLISVGIIIAAEIMSIIGAVRASKDEAAFKNALFALIAGIAGAILVVSAGSGSFLATLGNALNNIAGILTGYFVCSGIISLADQLRDAEVSREGQKVRSLLIVVWLASGILDILSSILKKSGAGQTVLTVISVISSVAMIIGCVYYIGLLKKAKNMLAQ